VRLRDASRLWNVSAYTALRQHHGDELTGNNLNDLAERTEVLSELWTDVAEAYAAAESA